MDLIEQLGAYLGLAAFLGFAVLVLLYFQQARDVRRLREWAGRAPERAAAAAEEAMAKAAREAGGAPEEAPDRVRGTFLARLRTSLPATLRVSADARDLMREPRFLAAIGAVAVLVAAAAVTGAFGLLGSDEGSGRNGGKTTPPGDIEVAVLNGTGTAGAPGIAGLADTVAKNVKKAGYEVGAVADASSPVTESLIMYRGKDREEANQVAADLRKQLGKTKLGQMSPEVEELADGAAVAVVIGPDDSQL